MSDSRDSFLKMLRQSGLQPNFNDPNYTAIRQQQELQRTIADAQWLRERGIVAGRQPLARIAGAETYMGPSGDPSKMPGNEWRSMPWYERLKQAIAGTDTAKEKQREFFRDLPEYYTREYQKLMPMGDIPLRDKHGRIYKTVPREEWDRMVSPLSPTEEAAADPLLMLVDLLAPGPGGAAAKESRVFFGSPAQRARALHVLDWARKNLRGEARRGLLRVLDEGVLLGEEPGFSLGLFNTTRGRGAFGTSGTEHLTDFLSGLEAAAEQSPEAVKQFVQQNQRFLEHAARRKLSIMKAYKELADKGVDVPISFEDTPAPPFHTIEVDTDPGRKSAHPLSTTFHEFVHAILEGMVPGRAEKLRRKVGEGNYAEVLKERGFPVEWADEPEEQIAALLQRLGSGEELPHRLSREMDEGLAGLQGAGFNIPGLWGNFPSSPANMRSEMQAMQPTFERWTRWRKLSGEKKQAEKELAELKDYLGDFVEGLRKEQTLAQKMRKR